jgi:type IV secretory pathway TraG/TraD family ATPase VirD4
LHGDAKIASRQDIKHFVSVTLGNYHTTNIVVSKYKGQLIKYLKANFVSLGAGTRSGKGLSIVIPNLLEWQESSIVLDIKQECFNITGKYRQQVLKQNFFLFPLRLISLIFFIILIMIKPKVLLILRGLLKLFFQLILLLVLKGILTMRFKST